MLGCLQPRTEIPQATGLLQRNPEGNEPSAPAGCWGLLCVLRIPGPGGGDVSSWLLCCRRPGSSLPVSCSSDSLCPLGGDLELFSPGVVGLGFLREPLHLLPQACFRSGAPSLPGCRLGGTQAYCLCLHPNL